MGNGPDINKKLRILFITQEDPFYVRIFFDEFLNHYRDRIDITGVVICSTIGKQSLAEKAKRLFDLYGFIDFSRLLVRYAGSKISGQTLKQLFKKYQIPCFDSPGINSDQFVSHWLSMEIDVIVSVASSEIFKPKLLKVARWGCINIHHAKLPRYRGMMPNFWQMYFDEKSAGITVHKINKKIDDGEILLQRDVIIQDNETLDSLIKRTKRIGARCIFEVLECIRQNKVVYFPNDPGNASYYSFPTKLDARVFRKKGKKLL
ncbi:MAG TPA: formyltransferase family protein [Candidatus Omnitrophota bacterium]|nr:formyltransferase family protein [Candidatus Omnitrophota bacterium]